MHSKSIQQERTESNPKRSQKIRSLPQPTPTFEASVSGATKANRTGVSTEADLMSQWRAVKRREAQCHQTHWDPGEAEGLIWPGWREHLGDALVYMESLKKVILPGFLCNLPINLLTGISLRWLKT